MSMTKTTGIPAVTSTAAVKIELFTLAATSLAEHRIHYEDVDERFVELVGELALSDDGWLVRFLSWLRGFDELASAAVVGAAEMVRTRLRAGLTTSGGNRKVISDALRRADEPGELLAYWFKRYGRAVPKPIRHGLADAAVRLYDEPGLAAYDLGTKPVRFADVISLVHPKAASKEQNELFRYAVARRGRNAPIPTSLPMLRARGALYQLSVEQRLELLDRPEAADLLKTGGVTCEHLGSWLAGVKADARAWAALLTGMGYRDRLRHLNGLAGSGLPEDILAEIGEYLADASRVAAEAVLPLEILAAGGFDRWAWALEQAMDASLAGVPSLSGRTLVLVDRSASMLTQIARGSAVTVADQATVFGSALALRSDFADLIQFGTSHQQVTFAPEEPLASVAARFGAMGDGNAAQVVRARYDGHDRVVIVTDEPNGSAWQGEHPTTAVPDGVPTYIWNVAATPQPSESVAFVFAGITDSAFHAIPLIESAGQAVWPF